VWQVRSDSINQLVFSIIPLSFAVVHLLLFIFYPRFTNNLFYALSMLGFAVLAFTAFYDPFVTSWHEIVLMMIFNIISVTVAISFGMLSVYTTIYKKLPLYTFLPMISLVLITLMFFLLPWTQKYFPMVMYVLLALGILDIGRLTLRSSRTPKEWGWIIGAGFTLSLLVFAYQFLMNAGIVPAIGNNREVWMYGIPILAVSLSIYISLSFAQTHHQLTDQLARVKKLSDEALTQERRAKDEEIRRRLLQADNERKTEELEEARRLQLSMLPKQVPTLDHLDIAVSMQTATEVGGDYYDFYPDGRDSLLFAIGDATGHGIKAGTMVASTKALFNSFRNDENLDEVLTRWSAILHSMNLGNLFMSISLVRVNGRTITLANAGMPPALHYRAASGQIDEMIQKSLPLGSSLRFPYTTAVFEAEPGDVLLFMSDGLPELFNQKKEEFELGRVKSALQLVCTQSAKQIVRSLNDACVEWQNTAHQNDDITLIAVKFL
jgi:serine phosphatase RsbU (regulator of sigma subunit)